MKNSKIKLVALLSLVLMLLSIFTMPAQAATNEKIILKKANDEFLIYYKEICNEEFEFAFSLDPKEEEDNLIFTKSAKDQLTDTALNVAYVDEYLFTNYFNSDKPTYIWVRNNKGKMLVSADLLNLDEAILEETVEFVNTTTKRIKTHTETTEPKTEIVDGVETTVTTGKLVLDNKENKYSYELIKVANNAEAEKLFNLVEKLQKNEKLGTYENLTFASEFYDLYNKLMPKTADWTKVDDSEILQPENTLEGEKYIVYLKDEQGVVDVQFLTSVYKVEEGVKEETETITETVKLPVTFDSGSILFIILAVIVLALVIVTIVRVKANKKDEKKQL